MESLGAILEYIPERKYEQLCIVIKLPFPGRRKAPPPLPRDIYWYVKGPTEPSFTPCWFLSMLEFFTHHNPLATTHILNSHLAFIPTMNTTARDTL
jgi:hypothetical protein